MRNRAPLASSMMGSLRVWIQYSYAIVSVNTCSECLLSSFPCLPRFAEVILRRMNETGTLGSSNSQSDLPVADAMAVVYEEYVYALA